MLARIKLTYPEIRDAIWNIDDNRLTVDNLIAIRQYIPTKEEIEIVKEYDGDVELLGNAERYFRAVNISLPFAYSSLSDIFCGRLDNVYSPVSWSC